MNITLKQFNSLATKEDLKALELARKEDFKAFELADKKNLEALERRIEDKFATKDDFLRLEKQLEVLADQVLKITFRLDDFVTKKEFDEKFDRIIRSEDKVIKMLEKNDLEILSLGQLHDVHEGRLDDHDKRLKVLELK